MLKNRVLQHLFERTATPFQVFTWIAPEGDYTLDSVRSEETHVSHVGQEEYPAGQVVGTEFKKAVTEFMYHPGRLVMITLALIP